MTLSTDKPILVTCAIIQKDDLVLIAQRKSTTKLCPNMWEFPGGKVDHAEHPRKCIMREIKEELNLDISVEFLLGEYSHTFTIDSKKYHVVVLCYVCKYKKGILKNIECQDSRWVRPNQIKKKTFVPTDRPMIDDFKKIKKSRKK